MKTKYKFFCFILTACLIFPAYTAPKNSTDTFAEQTVQSCSHNTLYTFDEETQTLNGVYEGNRVEALLADVAFVGDTAEVIWNGKSITEGELQVGMIVKIYHGDLLYGEYIIEQLQEPHSENPAQLASPNGLMRAAANENEFILPIDGMSLSQIPDSEDNRFNDGHRGVDIISNNGTSIRAMAAGKVVGYLEWEESLGKTGVYSWGNYVKIDHGNGYTTLYAHMNSAPLAKMGQWVSQGQVIGYVGSTGNSTTNHLHLEITCDGKLKNPLDYLHTYEYVWYEGTHPHVNYEQCTICGDLRSMGTYAATYEYTYYLTDHPHQQCGMCNICHIEKLTGERKTCNQVGIYASETHPHRRYRVYACGADEWLDSYGECNQVGIYVSETHPHRRYRVYACGADEWLDSYGECNQVGIYVSETHPHRRYRVYACGADEWLDSYGECKQVGIYASETHPHRRYRVYACGADEWLDSYGTCTCK